jgi:hypothetical protein
LQTENAFFLLVAFSSRMQADDFGALLAAETGSPLALLYLTKAATKEKTFVLEICFD